MFAKGYVDIRISGIGLDEEAISKNLGLIPNTFYTKGDTFVDEKYGGTKIEYEEDCWIVGTETEFNEAIEHTIDRFLEVLLPSAEYLKDLSRKHNITLWVSLYPEDEQSNIHISGKTINALCQIGISLDCSVSFLKDFYNGSYLS